MPLQRFTYEEAHRRRQARVDAGGTWRRYPRNGPLPPKSLRANTRSKKQPMREAAMCLNEEAHRRKRARMDAGGTWRRYPQVLARVRPLPPKRADTPSKTPQEGRLSKSVYCY